MTCDPVKAFVVGLSALFALTAPAATAVTIDWATVGDPGNTADVNGFGAVGYEYRIGKYEVTIGQYAEFLNAVAASDPYGLYSTGMAIDLTEAGILRSGSSGSYSYSVINNGGDSANRPVTYVDWFDAARFANWMHNGQGAGGTETGAYTFIGGQTSGQAPAKNPGALFYIPTESEWYKAAYFSPNYGGVGVAGYFDYATQSDTAPGNTIGSGSNQANYKSGVYSVTQSAIFNPNQNYKTDVGAFTNSFSYYNTFDQSGSVSEWNDLDGSPNSERGARGGSWFANNESFVSSAGGGADAATDGDAALGFRLASPVPVPEPASLAISAAMGVSFLAIFVRRRLRRNSR